MEILNVNEDTKILLATLADPIDIANKCVDVWYKTDERIGNENRIRLAYLAGLIVYKNEEVGYICVVGEKRYKKVVFVDMSIIKEYRNMGIGSSAMGELISNYNYSEYLIGEVTKNNIGANKSAAKFGSLIPINNDHNYYMFSKRGLESFNINEFEQKMSISESEYQKRLLHY